MLRLIAFALVPLALASGNAAAAKGGPSPGLMTVGWDGTWTRAKASATSPCRSRGRRSWPLCARATGGCSATRRSRAASAFRSSPSTARRKASPRDGRTLVLAEFGASQHETRFAVLSTRALRLQEDRDAPRPLVLRRTVARRPHALRHPVPRYRSRTRVTTSARSASSPASRSAERSSTSASRTRR